MKMHAPIILPRDEHARRYGVRWVQIDIPEVAAVDAPVSIEMDWEAFNKTVVYRIHGDRLWRPFEEKLRPSLFGETQPDLFEGSRPERPSCDWAWRHPAIRSENKVWRKFENVDLSWTPGEAEARGSSLYRDLSKRMRDRMLMIDGELHVESSGPIISIHPYERKIEWKPNVLAHSGGEAPLHEFGMAHQADDYAFPRAAWDCRSDAMVAGRDLELIGATPRFVGPQVSTPDDREQLAFEAGVWHALWCLRNLTMEKMTVKAVDLTLALRGALTRRWPEHRLNFDASHGDMWPHAYDKSDFPVTDELETLVEAVADGGFPFTKPTQAYLDMAAGRIRMMRDRRLDIEPEDQGAIQELRM